MKKHMEHLLKLDSTALNKKRAELMTEIIETRRGMLGGEIQNTQVVKAKRRELARVNTMLNTSSNSKEAKDVEAKTVVKKSKTTKTNPSTSHRVKETK